MNACPTLLLDAWKKEGEPFLEEHAERRENLLTREEWVRVFSR